jgi:hypothetical protein
MSKASSKNNNDVRQGLLFADIQYFHTKVISRKRDFDDLFEGFHKVRAISYVVSPVLLIEFFEAFGYTTIEAIVGQNLTPDYKQILEKKGVEVIERLAEKVENGSLRIYIPDRTIIHTKLYILEKNEIMRFVVSSANLTETAHIASRQINYALYADLPPDNALARRIILDYHTHLKGCSLFMEDLIKLFAEQKEMPRQEIIEVWIKGASTAEDDSESDRFLQEIANSAFESLQKNEKEIFTITLPESPESRKKVDRILKSLNWLATGNQVHANAVEFINYVQKEMNCPLMRVDPALQQTLIGINGEITKLTEVLPERDVLHKSLAHIENYISMVDLGQSSDKKFAKTNIYEAILFFLSAPFAHEYMKQKRCKIGNIDSRGPRFLYIYGHSQSGKSTFLRFATQLLTGYRIEPIVGNQFSKRRILHTTSLGTAFPIVFDDVPLSTKMSVFEEVLKSYWEVLWKEDRVFPHMIISSNADIMKDWALTRVKRVFFDVQFAATERNKERLSNLFKEENPIFRWFSHLYFQEMNKIDWQGDDELHLARSAMRRLYEHAERNLPDYFPEEPVDKIYDVGLKNWHEIVKISKKAFIKDVKNYIHVNFSEDMQHHEIKKFAGYLPGTVKHRLQGKTLIIENPDEFKIWFKGKSPRQLTFFSRLFKK